MYRLLKKLKKKLSFFLAGKGKLFVIKLFFEEFNLIVLTAENPWPVLKCRQGSDVLENFEVYRLLCGQGITLLKGNLRIYKCFIDVKFILVLVFKGKTTNCAPI